jgi:hypothetical protein
MAKNYFHQLAILFHGMADITGITFRPAPIITLSTLKTGAELYPEVLLL